MAQRKKDPVAEALKKLDDDYFDCRDLRHAWKKLGAFTMHNKIMSGQIIRTSQCIRCGTEKWDLWSRDGTVRYHSWYDYPEGYLIKVGLGQRIEADDVRRESVRRMPVFRTIEELRENTPRNGNGRAKQLKAPSPKQAP